MDSESSRPTVRKTTISKSSPTFGFSDVNVSFKRLHSPEKQTGGSKETSSRKIAKIQSRQESIQENVKSPAKILAEQKALRRLKTKSENEKKTEKINKRKENLRELHEKSKLLLQQNLNKKERKAKNASSNTRPLEKQKPVSIDTLKIQLIEEKPLISNELIKNPNNSFESIIIIEDSPSKTLADPVCDDNKLTKENAAKIIQRYFRNYTTRNKKKVNKKEELPCLNQRSHEKVDQDTNEQKMDALVLPDLYISYPYNIISSVKGNLSHKEQNDSENNIEEKKHSHSNGVDITLVTDNSNFSPIHITPNQPLELKNNNVDVTNKPIERNGNIVAENYTKDSTVLRSQTLDDIKLRPKYFKTSHHSSVEKGNLLNTPEVNLIWLRHKNKKILSPKFLQNSFQDEVNLLESFNDSLRQVQNIEKSLTSIREDELSSSDVESTQVETKDNNSTRFQPFLSTRDIFVVNNKRASEPEYKMNNAAVNTKQFIQKCYDNDKSLIVSQKGNIETSDTSDILISESDSIYEDKIKSCLSSTDLTNFDENFMFNINHYRSSNVTNRLNRFCLCLVSQYIEDEKVRSEYLNTLLKVREKTLLDATRNELLCLEMQKKQNHSQIPLLKKKQRGLLLKLQQERNEIKHIKKFQHEQSQERKASLRRQLKHLKQMLACEEMLFSTKKRNKNSTLNISRQSINSPMKGINITIGSDTQTNNNSLTKIWECLEKRRQTLNEQKQKMHDLLHLHFDNIFDSAEIKIIQEKLSKTPSVVENTNMEKSVEPVLKTSNELKDSVKIFNHKDNSDEIKIKSANKRFNGNTLNILWEKITGHKCNQFENNKIYNMTKESLDLFFNDAKQVAINNMLSTLQNSTKVEAPKLNSVDEPLSQSLPSNKIESTSFLNNLLKSEGRELADLISKDKEAQQEFINKNEKNSNENVFAVENFSNDGSDTSKSTAHSLVDELSYLYPNLGENNEESEKENHSSTPSTEKEPQQSDNNIEDLKESEDITENTNKKKKSSSNEPIVPPSSKSEDIEKNKSSIQKNVLKIHNASTLNLESRVPSSPDLLIQKPLKISKSTNTISDKTINTKITLFLDNTADSSTKRFYSDDHSFSRLLENKSPVNTDYLVGPWDSVSPSPDPSPRDSPTGEYSPAAASLPLCHLNEAEELRRKQLAIELEIKALEQQQTQLPYCLVREIPDKPPPPYIPPSDEKAMISPVKVVEPKSPPSISTLIESFCSWLWSKFSDGKSEIILFSDYCTTNKFVCNSQDYTFIFDVCLETFQLEYSKISSKESTPNTPWEYKKDSADVNDRKCEKVEICNKVQNKVKDLIGIETTPIRENLIISWTQKRQDFVNNLLIKELYREEADWLNIEPYEMDIKNDLTNSILNSLIVEACNELKSIIIVA